MYISLDSSEGRGMGGTNTKKVKEERKIEHEKEKRETDIKRIALSRQENRNASSYSNTKGYQSLVFSTSRDPSISHFLNLYLSLFIYLSITISFFHSPSAFSLLFPPPLSPPFLSALSSFPAPLPPFPPTSPPLISVVQ